MDVDPQMEPTLLSTHASTPTKPEPPSPSFNSSVPQPVSTRGLQHHRPLQSTSLKSSSQNSPTSPFPSVYASGPQHQGQQLHPHSESPDNFHSPSYQNLNHPLSPSTRNPPYLGGSLQDHKRPRACESCRSLKVRCEPNDPTASSSDTCRRCAKANRLCIFTLPTRKRQKKADSKVAELERKIDALTATLNASRQVKAPQIEGDDDGVEETDEHTSTSSHRLPSPASVDQHGYKRRRSITECIQGAGVGETGAGGGGDGYGEDCDSEKQSHRDSQRRFGRSDSSEGPLACTNLLEPRLNPQSRYRDVIERRLVSLEMAKRLYDHYIRQIAPHFPVMVLNCTMEELRCTKPILFLTILSVASGTLDNPDLHCSLRNEAMHVYADRIVVRSDKSLELIQSLLLMALWIYPLDVLEELKFYTLIHNAALMAIDIGLGRVSRVPLPQRNSRGEPAYPTDQTYSVTGAFDALTTKDKCKQDFMVTSNPNSGKARLIRDGSYVASIRELAGPVFPDPCTMESRRTILVCFWASSTIAVALRRQNMLRFSRFMKESVKILETSPDAEESDKVLCQWVKLQVIAEEMAETFEFDDPSVELSIEEPRVQVALRQYSARLEEWKHTVDPKNVTKHLHLNYYLTVLLTHEIALHVDHNIDDYRPPFTERAVREPMLKPNCTIPPYRLDAISACIKAAKSLLEVFCTFAVEDMHNVPIFTFVRLCYAFVVLIKIYVTAAMPDAQLGKLVNKEDMRIDEYLKRVIEPMERAAGADRNRPTGRFVRIIISIQSWFMKRKLELHNLTSKSNPNQRNSCGQKDQSKVKSTPENHPIMPEMHNDQQQQQRQQQKQQQQQQPPLIPRIFAQPNTKAPVDDRQSQTPLQMLSNAAAGLQFPVHQRQQQAFDGQQQQLPNQLQNYAAAGSMAFHPGWYAPSGMPVEFQGGQIGMQYGGAIADALTDDCYWGVMEEGFGGELDMNENCVWQQQQQGNQLEEPQQSRWTYE